MALKKIFLGAGAMSSVTIIRMIAQMAIVPVLARLLTPEEYGLMGMAMPIILFIMIFSDIGVTGALLRTNDRTHQKEWSSTFWAVMGMGGALSCALILMAPVIGWLLSEPRVVPIISTLAAVIFLQSLVTVPGAFLQYHKKFFILAGTEFISMAASIGAVIFFALAGYGVWALVLQQVVHYVLKCIFILMLSGYRPRLEFDVPTIVPHLKFGKDVLGSSAMNTLSQMVISLLMGRFLGVEAVGIYTMAMLFVTLPARFAAAPLQFVLYPYLAKIQDRPDQFRDIFIFFTRILVIIFVPSVFLLASAQASFFALLLSAKWHGAGVLFAILTPMAAFQAFLSLRGTVAMVMGRPDILARQSFEYGVISILTSVLFLAFGLYHWAVVMMVVYLLYQLRGIHMILPLVGMQAWDYHRLWILPSLVALTAVIMHQLLGGGLVLASFLLAGCWATLLIREYPLWRQDYNRLRDVLGAE